MKNSGKGEKQKKKEKKEEKKKKRAIDTKRATHSSYQVHVCPTTKKPVSVIEYQLKNERNERPKPMNVRKCQMERFLCVLARLHGVVCFAKQFSQE